MVVAAHEDRSIWFLAQAVGLRRLLTVDGVLWGTASTQRHGAESFAASILLPLWLPG